jgi:hypothetical protein
MWLSVGSRGYVPGPTHAHTHDHSPTEAYPGNGFAAHDNSLATGSLHNQKSNSENSSSSANTPACFMSMRGNAALQEAYGIVAMPFGHQTKLS